MNSSGDFGVDDADALRRSIGVFVRAVYTQTEPTPDNQIDTLGYLMRDGAQSIAALARKRRIRHQSMSTTIADLEAQGLVERSRDPGDARGVLISLTSAGSRLVAESREARAALIQEAAARALSPADRAVLARVPALLDRLSATFDADRSGLPRP